MVTNNVTVYQFEVGLDEVFADEVRFHVNVVMLMLMCNCCCCQRFCFLCLSFSVRTVNL